MYSAPSCTIMSYTSHTLSPLLIQQASSLKNTESPHSSTTEKTVQTRSHWSAMSHPQTTIELYLGPYIAGHGIHNVSGGGEYSEL